jgi:5-methylcytosine-specific restriction endonuclease McrA
LAQFLNNLLSASFLLTLPLDADAARFKSPRSSAVRAEFQRLHPCLLNGLRKGPCPGYNADHKIPLKCGGADHPSNMQWLTVKAHKRKTKREARWCRR